MNKWRSASLSSLWKTVGAVYFPSKIMEQAQLTQTGGPPVPACALPATGEEILFLKALQAPRLSQVTAEELKQVLRYIMVIVGLRAQNWPQEADKQILLHHITTNYRNHTIAEVRLAFDMAVAGQLEVEIDHYQDFSCLYFSRIMTAYRVWASQAYRQLKKEPVEAVKKITVDWRGLIEKDYQQYRHTREINYKLFPNEYYEQAVADHFIDPMLYKEHQAAAKNELAREIQLIISNRMFDDIDREYSRIQDLQNLLLEYRNGQRNVEIVLRAKQVCVFILFTEAARKHYKNLYIDKDKPLQ